MKDLINHEYLTRSIEHRIKRKVIHDAYMQQSKSAILRKPQFNRG
jgi:hypothetical protein